MTQHRGSSLSNSTHRTAPARLRLILLSSCAALLSAEAWAASDADAESPGASPIAEVVVTAQRREESLQRVPVAVSVLTGQAIEKAGINDTTQLAQLAPGLTLSRVAVNMTPYIRGIGTPVGTVGLDQAVAVYLDGVYMPSPASTIFELSDVQRIEVLRGPQGTLFGRNATGGAIQVVTRAPGSEMSGELRASYENYQTYRMSAYVTGPVTSGVAASLTVSKMEQAKGWGRSLLTGADVNLKDELGARAKVLFQPVDSLDLTLSLDYTKVRSDIGLVRSIRPGSLYLDGRGAGDLYDYRGTFPPQAGGSTEQYGGYLRGELRLTDDITVQSTSGLRHVITEALYDQDGSPANSSGLYTLIDNHAYQQEVLILGQTGKLNWTAGVNYTEDLGKYKDLRSFTPTPSTTNNLRVSQILTRAYAAFGQATYAIADATNVTLGVRYSQERKTLNGVQYALPGHPSGNGAILATAVNKQESASEVTWRVAIDHRFADAIMVYGSASRGFKSGGFSGSNLANPPVLPETLHALEAGFKGDLFDGRFRLNGSFYHYKYRNIQLTQLVTGTTLTTNAATAKSHGAELEAVFVPDVPTGRLQFRGSLTVARGEYTSFPNGPLIVPNPAVCTPVPMQTGPATGGNRSCTADLSGRDMIRMPNWTSTLGVTYTVPAFGGDLELSADYFHSGRFYWEASNRITQPAYDLVSAQASWTTPDEKLTLRLFGRNLTDQKYATQGSESTSGDLIGPGPPRTYGFGISARF